MTDSEDRGEAEAASKRNNERTGQRMAAGSILGVGAAFAWNAMSD